MFFPSTVASAGTSAKLQKFPRPARTATTCPEGLTPFVRKLQWKVASQLARIFAVRGWAVHVEIVVEICRASCTFRTRSWRLHLVASGGGI